MLQPLHPTAPMMPSADAPAPVPPDGTEKQDESQLREAFDAFVGQTFYGQLMKSLRSTVDKPAYFHGGRAEEIFEGQLDQVLAENMAKNDRGLSDSMFHLFMLNLKQS